MWSFRTLAMKVWFCVVVTALAVVKTMVHIDEVLISGGSSELSTHIIETNPSGRHYSRRKTTKPGIPTIGYYTTLTDSETSASCDKPYLVRKFLYGKVERTNKSYTQY